jgi:uncharacterized membrane protein YbhN (UPF0104 family)
MRAWLKKWWSVGKALLAVAILVAIGRGFAADLEQTRLGDHPLRPGWLALCGLLYLLGLGCWAGLWHRLMQGLDQHPRVPVTARAYFLGQLGKYLPGKAMALVMRAALAAGPRVHGGLAGLTAFYEVLTDMAFGALLAALLFLLVGPDTAAPLSWEALLSLLRLKEPVTFSASFFTRPTASLNILLRLEEPAAALPDRRVLVLLALLLSLPIGVFLLPPVMNRLAHRLSRPFVGKDAPALPRFRWSGLAEGCLWAAGSWFLLGTSLWVMLQAVPSRPPDWAWDAWALTTGCLALAYVAGFIILVVPSGLGVREFFLTLLLVNPKQGLDKATVVVTVVLLRLVWTTAELVLVAVVYWLPATRGQEAGASSQESGNGR